MNSTKRHQVANRAKKHTARLGGIEREILYELSLGDVLVGMLTSARSTKIMMRTAHERAMHRYRRKKALLHLIDCGYIQKKGESVSIGQLGRRALDDAISKTHRTLQSTRWDGKWRIVSFDIPERFRGLRNRVRTILLQAGFEKIHQSLWVFPHECEKLVELIKSETSVERYVLYGVLEHIENDSYLRHLFSLKKV